MSQIKANDNAYIAHTYGRFDIVLTHGSGALLYDENEKEYIDMTAGIGCKLPGIWAMRNGVKAVCEQATSLQHVSNLYYSKPDTQVAEKIV